MVDGGICVPVTIFIIRIYPISTGAIVPPLLFVLKSGILSFSKIFFAFRLFPLLLSPADGRKKRLQPK